MDPSNGRSGCGFTIFASTWAKTLVFPSAHSTHPSSGPNVIVGVRISNGDRPSSLKDSFKALKRNSLSGIDGEGGLIFTSKTLIEKEMRQK